MDLTSDIVMLGWIPVVLGLFATLPPRRALIAAYLVAWLFLPMTKYPLPGLPDYTKISATSVGTLVATLLFHYKCFSQFKPGWPDVPICAFCLSPFLSSWLNGLGIYDGISASLTAIITWGLPFLLGRVFIRDAMDIKELAVGIVIAGLIYLPLCLFEIRMSPQLHSMVYGYHQHSFGQTKRFGGWRPTVFMQHGLMVGMWMSVASLVCYWLWVTGAVKKLCNVSIGFLTTVLFATSVLCRSTGALALLGLGILTLHAYRHLQSPVWLAVILIPIMYIGARTTGLWHGGAVKDLAGLVSEDRRASFEFRLNNEDLLIDKALKRPLFGWGGWLRNRVFDDKGKDIAVPDGHWIQLLGINGFVGLVLFYLSMLGPAWMVSRRLSYSGRASEGPPAVLMLCIVLYSIDCLMNSMENPIMFLALGSICNFRADQPDEEWMDDESVWVGQPRALWPRARRVDACEV